MMNFRIYFVLLALTISSGHAQIFDDDGKIPDQTNPEFINADVIPATNDIHFFDEIILEIEGAFTSSQKSLTITKEFEVMLAKNERVINPSERKTDPSLIRDEKIDPVIQDKENWARLFEDVARKVAEKYDLTSDDIADSLHRFPLNGLVSKASRDDCIDATQPQDPCDCNSRYRTPDGLCNNLNNPEWGSAMVCQRRLLPANYVGIYGFPVAVSGDPLPAPRELSLNLHNHLNRPTKYVTHMYMFFGQLLAHDITLTPDSTTVDNQAIQCCPPKNQTHPQCAPILIDEDDPFYSDHGITCLNFVRSAICSTCTLGHRIQLDQVTSFIDASFVYGNSKKETDSLRTKDDTGRLRVQDTDNGELLPRSSNPKTDQCSFPETNEICFEAGDPRVNQHTVLVSLQTIFMREHNRIADELREMNDHWDGERVFQEARRIIGAEMQVITYKEYLPITLGRHKMSNYRLCISKTGTTSYDPEEDPTMAIEFSTSAFRFGHSLVNSVVADSPLNATDGCRLLRNEFFQPFDVYNGIIGQLVRGASNSPAQLFDRHLVPDVTNFLHRVRSDPTGLDLAATNINRGRDHGIPTYVDMVRYCSDGEIEVKCFRDLVDFHLMKDEQSEALESNYQDVADVDLWTAILMEIPIEGAVVGPTAACIIGQQFKKLKFGDRFYFEHKDQVGSFIHDQMQELKKITLSKILCLNTNAKQLPRKAMLFSRDKNPYINCNEVKGIDLSCWKEEK